jgi:uncharacterized membrane protein YvlD (DUF360 family)
MIKNFLKSWLINCLSLAVLTTFFSGLEISGDFWQFLLVGLFVTIALKILKPVFNLLFLPLHLMTFGLFRVLHLSISLGLVIYLSNQMTLKPYHFNGLNSSLLTLKPFTVGIFGSLLITSILFSLLNRFFTWLIKYR